MSVTLTKAQRNIDQLGLYAHGILIKMTPNFMGKNWIRDTNKNTHDCINIYLISI